MSNCVVGSGGSRLPCSTIAEHRVEGCDHFSHDGDDDDLGFFVGVGEAIVEGFEGGTVSARAEGGHVEDITDRHPTTVDAAVSRSRPIAETVSGRNLATSSAQPAVSLLTEKNHPSGSTTTSKRSFDTSTPQKESMAIFVSHPC